MSQNVDERDLKEDYPSQLRELLTVNPSTGLSYMHLLEVLDLSSTRIQSLPSCISSLSSLKELLLRDCSFLIELPIEIGMLTKLKLLDMEGSEIMYIPKEILELKDLEVLRLCLSQYAEYYIKSKNVNGGVIVPRMMISKLKKLKELCISVCQEAEWWEKEIKEIQDEICHLENLEFLKWYLPTDTTLKQFLDIQINRKPAYEKLSNFTFTIGQHAQLTSCLPRDLEKKFAEFEKCLKWINADGNIYDISKIMKRANALFLSRHWTIVNLSAFDISNLKYFLLAECNEMETLVKIDDLSEVVENNKKSGLESLEYLSIHHMGKLKSIWEGPIGKDSLSRLRILALHTCLELTTIFTPRLAQNLSCLAELTVEECPKVRSLISTLHSAHGPLFPSLERIFLIDLPGLDHIFGGLIVLEKLESLVIYNCIKLRCLSDMELPRIQKIKGEYKWWKSLNAYAPTWENFFEPLEEKSELIKQLLEATNSLQHFHDVTSREAKVEKPLDGPGLGAQETKTDPYNFPLRKEEGLFHAPSGVMDSIEISEQNSVLSDAALTAKYTEEIVAYEHSDETQAVNSVIGKVDLEFPDNLMSKIILGLHQVSHIMFSVGTKSKTSEVQSKSGDFIRVDTNKNQVKSLSIPHFSQYKELYAALTPYHAQLVGESYLGKRRPVYDCIDVQVEAAKGFLRVLRSYLDSLCSNLRSHTITNVQLNDDKPEDANFANWSHQAVDFILDSVKNILSNGNITEPVEGTIGSLSLRLVRKMCTTSQGDEAHQIHTDVQFDVQHLLHKLGSEPCIGQRVILADSQRISLLAENLLFLDPFDTTFPEIHCSLYILYLAGLLLASHLGLYFHL